MHDYSRDEKSHSDRLQTSTVLKMKGWDTPVVNHREEERHFSFDLTCATRLQVLINNLHITQDHTFNLTR